MSESISQRELRHDSGRTTPELVDARLVAELLRDTPSLDGALFESDLDDVLDQGIEPRS